MAETGLVARFHGADKPWEMYEYPVPAPEPGAAIIKIAPEQYLRLRSPLLARRYGRDPDGKAASACTRS